MKVKVNEEKRKTIAPLYTGDLLEGKQYEAVIDDGKNKWYRIIDESGEDYLYPPELFDVIEKN